MKPRTNLTAFLLATVLWQSAAAVAAQPAWSFGGARVVVLSGTHRERGVAHGKALAAEVLDVVDNYVLESLNPLLYSVMVSRIDKLMIVDADMQAEAEGLVAGAREALGGNLRSGRLLRDIGWKDVVALNMYVDYVGAGCSSLSAWGDATMNSDLKERAVIARNLDWSLSDALLRNQVLFIHLPSEAGEKPFVSVGFAGFVGCLSCMSETGLAAFLNLGFGSRSGSFPPDYRFAPVSLTLRRGVEMPSSEDPVGTSVKTLTSAPRVGSFIVHVLSAASRPGGPAVVVELVSDGQAERQAADEKDLKGCFLVATNHHRKVSRPVECRRYETAREQARLHLGGFGPAEMWKLAARVRRDDTMQSMLFVPATGELWLAVRGPGGAGIPEPEKTNLRDLIDKARKRLPATLP